MPVYQLLECNIALGGDILNVVNRHKHIPVTFPEMLVIQHLHGPNSVTDIYDVGAVEREDAVEMSRLENLYTRDVIRKDMFPGAGVRLPNGDNRYKPRIVDPDKPLALTVPPPEIVHPAGAVADYVAVAEAAAGAGFTPSSPPVADTSDPFGDNADATQATAVAEPPPASTAAGLSEIVRQATQARSRR